MSAIAAAAITSGALGLYKVGEGISQKNKAKELAKNNIFQPEQMPGQIKQVTNLAAQNYYNGMPGMSNAQQGIARNSQNAFANGSQGASSGGDLIDLAAKLNHGDSIATNDLAERGAQYKQQALGGYQNALNSEAGWTDKLYKNNTLDPYLRTANTAASLAGAGNVNEFSGLDQIGTAALGYASNIQNGGDTNQTYGQKNNAPTLTPSSAAISVPSNQYQFNQPLPMQQGELNQSGVPYGTGWQPFNAASAMAKASLNKRGY